MNKYDKPVPVGGDPYSVVVTGPFGDQVEKQIKDNGNGTYFVQYLPRDSGAHKVEVTLKNQHCANSPYSVEVIKNLNEPDATHCEAHGPGLESGNKTTNPTHFTVVAKNRNGDQIAIPSKNPFEVVVHPPDDSPVDTKLEPQADGTLLVTYVPLKPGNYTIDVTCHSATNPAYFDHIKGSSFSLFIKPSPDLSNTYAHGPGLQDGIKDTLPAAFQIVAKDINGDDITEGGDPIAVTIQGPNGEDIPATLTDNNNGTYDVVYQPDGPGVYQVTPTVAGAPIKKAPYKVHIEEGADADHSGIEGFTFRIRARNKRGENMTKGGAKFDCHIEGPAEVQLEYHDNGDGLYVVNYALAQPGDYKVNVTMDGRHIKGSPWTQTF
jgi:filamin